MVKKLAIVSNDLLESYQTQIGFDPLERLSIKSQEKIPFDYFQFYTSVSSVYSSKIEGENIEADSFLKHKFLKVKYEPDYTKKADDLFAAYTFANGKKLNKKNVLTAHALLSQNLLAKSQRGRIRINPMFVLNEDDRIEYIACETSRLKEEWNKLFRDIKKLRKAKLTTVETFYYAAYIHLVFLKIHPLQDGNGRTARLIEKWFLVEKLGQEAISVELEKNYYRNKPKYYDNIRKIGLDYEQLDYREGLDFLLMTILSLQKK
ncbi:MAG: Fic family protein [Saprospiraceae bacterium]